MMFYRRYRPCFIATFVLLFLYMFAKVMIGVGYKACRYEQEQFLKDRKAAIGCLSWSSNGQCLQYPLPERKRKVSQ